MALTLGAHHVVTGAGQFAIAQPVGLVVSVSGIPAYVARDPGTPTLYHRLSKIYVGHTLGWQAPIDLVVVPQLVYPLAPELTILRYSFDAGETGTIDEIASSTSTTSLMQPWDRNPAPLVRQAGWLVAGGAVDTTQFTYTVPALRKLRITGAGVYLVRTTTPSAFSYGRAYLQINGAEWLDAYLIQQAVGLMSKAEMGAGPLDVPAGTVIRAASYNNDTGGNMLQSMWVHGFLFDA